MQALSNAEVSQFGVGAAPEGRQWHLLDDELVLFDKKRQQVVYRRDLSKPVEIEEKPPQRPSAAIPEGGTDEFDVRPEDFETGSGRLPQPRSPIVSSRFLTTPPSRRPPEQIDPFVDSLSRPMTQAQFDEGLRLSPVGAQMPVPQEYSEMEATEVEEKKQLASLTEVTPDPQFMSRVKKESEALQSVITDSVSTIGAVTAPDSSVVITNRALERESTPNSSTRLVIDPNTNEAFLVDSEGTEIRRFPVGTGDVTGTQYGKPYFTPTGLFDVINELPYKQVEGGFGPLWMGLGTGEGKKLTGPGGGGIGVHGPHARASFDLDENQFINQGYVSHGCIRFREDDILEIGRILDVGAQVEILPYR
jgi:lipoprotein-anchoring transpeptidase ErfK/SrfK